MAKDPYQYFRVEAREILEGLGRGVLQLEKGATPELAQLILRLAHTLKGAARVVKQPRIAEGAHAIEEALAPLREGVEPVARDRIDHVLAILDRIAGDVATLDLPAPVEPRAATPAPTRTSVEEPFRMVRAELAEMDTLLDGISEVGVHLRSMRRELGVLERARHLADLLADQVAPSLGRHDSAVAGGAVAARVRSIAQELRDLVRRIERTLPHSVDQVERETKQLRDVAEQLRLLPASSVFASLERTARDAARELGKQATFEAHGGDVRLDAQVLGVVQSALVQVVRNSLAHGIEPESERARVGKSPVGRLLLEVVRRGDRVAFVCTDDGRGIDVAAVRRVARARGISAADAEKLDGEGAIRLLLEGGLSTSTSVTEVSGRGIGLDVVREVSVRLGGHLTLHSDAGSGTTLELVVPVSLSSLDALLVEAGGVAAAIPIEAVRGTLRVAHTDVARTPTGDSIVHQGVVIPFLPLARALSTRAQTTRHERVSSVVVVAGGAAQVAFSIDRLLGTANVVMRSLPRLAVVDRVVAGTALDAEGDPQLVLDPARLMSFAMRPVAVAQAAATEAAPILVIDDSLTTRMLEQSILESAGYEVDVAMSAEEGLEKARKRRYGLFLVDVEMPGMDGFSFVEITQNDPVLRDVPAILVTSRNAPEDRRRGEEVGARSYMVKSEFDQGLLLATIRKLVG